MLLSLFIWKIYQNNQTAILDYNYVEPLLFGEIFTLNPVGMTQAFDIQVRGSYTKEDIKNITVKIPLCKNCEFTQEF